MGGNDGFVEVRKDVGCDNEVCGNDGIVDLMNNVG